MGHVVETLLPQKVAWKYFRYLELMLKPVKSPEWVVIVFTNKQFNQIRIKSSASLALIA